MKHDSYVAYEFAVVRHGALVDKQVQLGVYIQKENASDELVEKMRAGLKKSPFAKRGLKDDYDKAVRAEEKRKKQLSKPLRSKVLNGSEAASVDGLSLTMRRFLKIRSA